MPKKLVRTRRLIGEVKRAERIRRAERAENKGKPTTKFFDIYLKKKGHKILQHPTEVSVYWDDTAHWSGREIMELTITSTDPERLKRGTTWCKIQYVERKTHIEIYSIDVRPKGTGYGTEVMKDIFDYADAKGKGVIATKVNNEAFAESLNMKRRDPELSHNRTLSSYTGYAEYVRGPVPFNAIDYRWVTSGGD